MLGLLLLSWTGKIWTGPPGSVHNALQIFLATNDFPFGCSSVPHAGHIYLIDIVKYIKNGCYGGLLLLSWTKKFWNGPPWGVHNALQFFFATNAFPFGCSSVSLVGHIYLIYIEMYSKKRLLWRAIVAMLDQKILNGPSLECPQCVTNFFRHQRLPVWLF